MQQQLNDLVSHIFSGLKSLITFEDENGAIYGNNPRKNNRKYLRCPQKTIKYQPDHPYLATDPRINFIKRIISLMLPYQGWATDPFAFRLKNLNHWIVKYRPELFIYQTAWGCKADCFFCYQKGNPPFMHHKIRMSKEEILTRMRYLGPDSCLIYGTQYESDEALNNPYIKDIIRRVRLMTNTTIDIATNGTSLTENLICYLKKNEPISLQVSLNSADKIIRKRVMRDPRPEIAINSLPLLKKHKIKYFISIVTWPGIPFHDIEKTIRYAEKNDAWGIRLCLPGYSRYFPMARKFDSEAYWKRIVKFMNGIQAKYSIPILIDPIEYYHMINYGKIDVPVILGPIKNSPAYKCGIKPKDLILEINDKPVDTIEEAMEILLKNLGGEIKLKINRNGRILIFRIIDIKTSKYPYIYTRSSKLAPFGLFLLVGQKNYISGKDIEYIVKYIIAKKAKKVLILTSKLLVGHIKYLLDRKGAYNIPNVTIKVAVAKNYYLGGNIHCADLLTVDDYIRNIREQMKRYMPDQIIIPSSPFNVWERDFTGRCNLDIEREIGVPVEIIYNG